MDAVRQLFGASRVSHPPAPDEPDDVIYPVHMLDGAKMLRGITVVWTLQFNDVLNPDALHESLTQLLEIGDWRKVGGRLRIKVRSS